MGARILALMILLIWVPMGCAEVAPSTSPQPTTVLVRPPKQPEPSRPKAEGEISGVPEGTLGAIHIRTIAGRNAHTVGGPFPGHWEAVVTTASGTDYIVTAEAEGYVSQPVSYTIHIDGDYAYLVREGQVTDEEALHLDFHFTASPSANK